MQRLRQAIGEQQQAQLARASSALDDDNRVHASYGSSRYGKIRYKTFLIFDDPDSSIFARIMSYLVMSCIFLSTLSIILESVPSLEKYRQFWFNTEVFFVAIFSVEYFGRLWATSLGTCEFVRKLLNVVDLMSILPFYLYCIMGAAAPVNLYILRVLRLFRLIQMFKLARYSKTMFIIMKSIGECKEALLLMMILIVMATIIFGSLMVAAERGIWNVENACYMREEAMHLGCSPFSSVPQAMYWGITTLTGVGYGDTYPVTAIGKVIAGCTMVCGILCLALPVVLIGVHFSNTMVFLQSEIESKAYRKVLHPELFEAVHDYDNICLRAAVLNERILSLVICANDLNVAKTHPDLKADDPGEGQDEDNPEAMEKRRKRLKMALDDSKPAMILSRRVLGRFLDMKKYVNTVDLSAQQGRQ